MHFVNIRHNPTNEIVPVLKMRVLDYGRAQFFAYVDGAWQWVDSDEFGELATQPMATHVHVV